MGIPVSAAIVGCIGSLCSCISLIFQLPDQTIVGKCHEVEIIVRGAKRILHTNTDRRTCGGRLRCRWLRSRRNGYLGLRGWRLCCRRYRSRGNSNRRLCYWRGRDGWLCRRRLRSRGDGDRWKRSCRRCRRLWRSSGGSHRDRSSGSGCCGGCFWKRGIISRIFGTSHKTEYQCGSK